MTKAVIIFTIDRRDISEYPFTVEIENWDVVRLLCRDLTIKQYEICESYRKYVNDVSIRTVSK